MSEPSMTAAPPAAPPAVTVEIGTDHVALVTINRPEARNAVNGAVAAGLEAAIDQTEANPDIWAVIITGTGTQAFCAGADLKEISAGRGAGLRTERGGFAGFVHAPRTKPWIAAVNGPALAGGCEIVLTCELVVAAEGAVFGLPEVKRGLMAVAGGLYRLPRVPRRDYIVIDRHHLGYLNALQKLNCVYCGYVTGLIGWTREIASVTEQYWCPIKHFHCVKCAHKRYKNFLNFGDGEGYAHQLDRIRKEFGDLEFTSKDGQEAKKGER